jgi:hypothetical protein
MNNATTSAITPEPTAPVDFDYAAAERTVIDRAEFARLIRKHKSLRVCVFMTDNVRGDVVHGCASECFGVKIPAKQALEELARCTYDACAWELDEYGPSISTHIAAPAWVQMKRRRDFIAARIPHLEARLAMPARVDDRLDANFRAWTQRDLIHDRAELARWDAELAARKAQPLAA